MHLSCSLLLLMTTYRIQFCLNSSFVLTMKNLHYMALFLQVYHLISTCLKHPKPGSANIIQLQRQRLHLKFQSNQRHLQARKVIAADFAMPLGPIFRQAK